MVLPVKLPEAIFLWLGLIVVVPVLAAEIETEPQAAAPPWASPEILKAAIEIRMDETQQQVFRSSIGGFIDSYFKMLNKETRRRAPDIERRIKRRTTRLIRKMDNAMKAVLSDEQWPAYEQYRDLLVPSLQRPAAAQLDLSLEPADATHH